MKLKKGMRALGLLLVVALAGAIFVPAVSAIDIETVEKIFRFSKRCNNTW